MCFSVIVAEADVYKANNVGATPLYWASLNGHVDVVNVLLAAEIQSIDDPGSSFNVEQQVRVQSGGVFVFLCVIVCGDTYIQSCTNA